MENRVELLAPAGDWEAFLAAIENGADAVYLGGKLFNARQFAGNFDTEKLKEAIDYAHIKGARVYLTMNTLILDSEIRQAVDFVEEAYVMGVDGIIIQDLGFAGLLRSLFPDLPLHASTQMTTYNLEGVKVLEKLGFTRVVLARELSIDEINYIAKNTSLEIEVFIHGALCICYSGQCLLSSIIGGRSGNRGKCAQPCRLPYELISDTGKVHSIDELGRYLLSPKDMCSINEQRALIHSGVKSFKIEGRMKSPEYVAKVVQVYRKYLDIQCGSNWGKAQDDTSVSTTDMKELTQIFNRGGFTSGYLKGKTGRDMMCYEKPKNWGIYLGKVISYNRNINMVRVRLEENLAIGDGIEIWNGEEESPGACISEIRLNGKNESFVGSGNIVEVGSLRGRIFEGNQVYKTSDKRLNTSARETFTGRSVRKSSLDCKMIIKVGEPVSFCVSDDVGNKSSITGEILPEKAINKPLTKERINEQIRKTGSTPFEFNEVEMELDENLALPLSEINNLRRKALEDIEIKRAAMYRRSAPQNMTEKKVDLLHFPGNSRMNKVDVKVSAFFYNYDSKIDYSILDLDRIYLPFTSFLDEKNKREISLLKGKGCELYAWIPSITRGNYDDVIKRKIRVVIESGIDGILIGNIGSITLKDEFPEIKFSCDSSINAFNSFSIGELYKLGLAGITLSLELNLKQISSLRVNEEISKETLVYGRIPVMTSEYCPVGSIEGGFAEGKQCSKPCTGGSYKLKDRMGMEFPIFCDKIDCRSILFNSNVLFAFEYIHELKKAGVNMVRMNFTDEKPNEVIRIIDACIDIVRNGKGAMDQHKELCDRVRNKGFTKGHYLRGV